MLTSFFRILFSYHYDNKLCSTDNYCCGINWLFQLFQVGVSRALSAFRTLMDTSNVEQLNEIGCNPGHIKNLDTVSILAKEKSYKLSKILRKITRNKNLGINRGKNLCPKSRKLSLKPPKNNTTLNENISQFTSYDIEKTNAILAWVN